MQKWTRSLLMTGALALGGLAGCGDDVTVTEPAAGVTSVTVAPATATVNVGGTVTLVASVVTVGNAASTVTWTSSAATVATVSPAGVVTGVAPGTATITASATADPTKQGAALVTVSRGVNGITLSQTSAVLNPGQTLQVTATVDAAPGVARTVTWTSSNTAVATVSAAGLITAVAPGSATITAASTVDASITAPLALTVRTPTPPTILLEKVTVQGNVNATVNFNNVAGPIDVHLQVDPGDFTLARVEVLVDGVVRCTQNFTAAQSEQLRLAAVFEELAAAAVPVICPINTAEFNPTTGATTFANGQHTLSARAIVTGGGSGGAATPSVQLTFNNTSGFVATITNTNTNGGGAPNSAVNPTTGQAWTQGTHTLTLVGVNYVSGQTYTNISGNLFGKTFSGTPASGQTYTFTFPGTSTTGLGIDNYQSPAAGEVPVLTAAALSNGQNGSVTILNWDDPATANNDARDRGLTPLPQARVDNVDPAAPTVAAMPIWLNAAFSFNTSGGVTNGVDTGVDAVTRRFFYIAGALPTAGGACDVTGMTEIATGSQLAETIVSTTYRGRVVTQDLLGNKTCADLAPGNVAGATFGADFQAPTGTLTAPANNSAFNNTGTAAAAQFAWAVTDNASGFDAAPARVSITRLNANNTTTCVIGSTPTGGTLCSTPAAQPLSFSATGGATTEGYYTHTTFVVDQANNALASITRLFLVDATAPAFSGGVSIPANIAGQAAATFTTAATDNLDLNSVYGIVSYPIASIRYPDASLGTFGPPLTQTAPVNFTVSSFIRCLNGAGVFTAVPANEANSITLGVTDQAANETTQATPIPAANVADCGAIGNVAFAAGFTFNAPSNTTVSRDNPTGNTNPTTTVLTAVADVQLNTSADPFQRVEFYWQPAAGQPLRLIGTGTAVLAQTPTNRTWTYTLTWDPAAPVPTGVPVNVMAIGVDAEGDAVFATNIQVVTIAP